MNWLEFKAECEQEIAKAGVDPAHVIVRIEVDDDFYDKDADANRIYMTEYDRPYLILYGGH